MSLTIQLVLDRNQISTWEPPTVTVDLRNATTSGFDGYGPPSTAGWRFNFYTSDGSLALHARYPMPGGPGWGGPREPSSSTLGPGETWSWSLHLAKVAMTLAAGSYALEVEYRDPKGDVVARSAREQITVATSAPTVCQVVSDSPTLARTMMLVGDDNNRFFLRQQPVDDPEHPGYAKPLTLPADTSQLVLAEAGFFTTASFAHVASTVVLCRQADLLTAYPVDEGVVGDALHQAELPRSQALLPTATYDREGVVTLACWSEGALQLYKLGSNGLRLLRTLRPSSPARHVRIAQIKRELHVVFSGQQLHHCVLDEHGTLLRTNTWGPFRHRTRQLDIDRKATQVRAVFDAGPGSRELCCVTAHLRNGSMHAQELATHGLDGNVEEFAFGRARSGQLHALARTNVGTVAYLDHNGAHALATTRGPCFPFVTPGAKTFVGFADSIRGVVLHSATELALAPGAKRAKSAATAIARPMSVQSPS